MSAKLFSEDIEIKASHNLTYADDDETLNILYKFSSVYLVILILLGIFLNTKAIASLLEVIKTRKTDQNFLLINLIFSELSISAILPLDLLASLTNGEIYEGFSFFCQFAGFSQTFFSISSLYTITGMAIVRYLSVVRLERSWHIHNTNINFWTSPCIWIAWLMGIVFAFPPLIGLGDFKLDTSKICCTPQWSTSSTFGVSYNCFLISVGFFLPTFVIVASNVLVMRKLKQQAQVLNRHKSTNKALKKDDKPETRSTEINRFKSTQSIASTIGLMTAAFYICWTPYAVRCIIELVGYSLPPIVYTLTILFAKLGVVINPVLYIFYNKLRNSNSCPTGVVRNTVNVLGEISSFRKDIEIFGLKRTKVGIKKTNRSPKFLNFANDVSELNDEKLKRAHSMPEGVNKISSSFATQNNLEVQKAQGFRENLFRRSSQAVSSLEIDSYKKL